MYFILKKNYFLFFAIFASLIIGSCSKDQDYDKSKAVLAYVQDNSLEIDKNLQNIPISLPEIKPNHNFLGSLTALNQVNENIEKNYQPNNSFLFNRKNKFNIRKSWAKSFFYASSKFENFHYEPIIFKEKIYFLDSSGELLGYDLKTKKQIFESQIFDKKTVKNYRIPQISFANNKIFATIGSNHISVADAINGKIIWQKQVSAILSSKPIVSDNLLYVASDNNHLYCFNVENGELVFSHMGVNRSTAILGTPMPVIYQDKILVAYSSGEIYALNKKSGEVIWVQDLNLNKAITSDFYLNDVDANILVKNDVAYAIGNGGLMKAINIKNGSQIWKKQIAGISNFWLAKDYLYVINLENKLIAINRLNSKIKLIKQLPAYKNIKKPATKFIYNGLIMAGNKLLISRDDGVLIAVSPLDGNIENSIDIGKKISHSPIVVDDKIYLQSVGNFTIEIIELK